MHTTEYSSAMLCLSFFTHIYSLFSVYVKLAQVYVQQTCRLFCVNMYQKYSYPNIGGWAVWLLRWNRDLRQIYSIHTVYSDEHAMAVSNEFPRATCLRPFYTGNKLPRVVIIDCQIWRDKYTRWRHSWNSCSSSLVLNFLQRVFRSWNVKNYNQGCYNCVINFVCERDPLYFWVSHTHNAKVNFTFTSSLVYMQWLTIEETVLRLI